MRQENGKIQNFPPTSPYITLGLVFMEEFFASNRRLNCVLVYCVGVTFFAEGAAPLPKMKPEFADLSHKEQTSFPSLWQMSDSAIWRIDPLNEKFQTWGTYYLTTKSIAEPFWALEFGNRRFFLKRINGYSYVLSTCTHVVSSFFFNTLKLITLRLRTYTMYPTQQI